ncbi:tyrosine-protein phosphatase [Pontitalea aquivivens]|uniref:tyrosine-protein phosphatase n=1 Tax=Pontitalea aquivivens TaxID=3388663 RepID=UPI0039707AB4
MVEGCVNFRAVESYAAADGRRLRSGQLYRSGAHDRLSETGLAQIRALAPGLVYDLRSRVERARMPSRLVSLGLNLRPEPHDISLGNPLQVLHENGSRPEQGHAAMIEMYRALPFDFAPILRDFLWQAGESRGPVLVHCQIGKDRTGAAVALLMSALGVDRNAIIEDYARTAAAVPQIRAQLRSRRGPGSYEALSDEVLDTVVAANPDYIRAFFDAITDREGSVAAYLSDRLGLDQDRNERLRALFLD